MNHSEPVIAAGPRGRRSKPHTFWHLGEVHLEIDSRLVFVWRAVDDVRDVLVQTGRNKRAALKLMGKPLKKYAVFRRDANQSKPGIGQTRPRIRGFAGASSSLP
jgi:transposase-like protein